MNRSSRRSGWLRATVVAAILLAPLGASACAGKRGHGAQIGQMHTSIHQDIFQTCVDNKGKWDRNGKNQLVSIFVWNVSDSESIRYKVWSNTDPETPTGMKVHAVGLLSKTPSKRAHAGDLRFKGDMANDPKSWTLVELTMKDKNERIMLTIEGEDKEEIFRGHYTQLKHGVLNNECSTAWRNSGKGVPGKGHSLADEESGDEDHAYGRKIAGTKSNLACADIPDVITRNECEAA